MMACNGGCMRRREFIGLIGGAAAGWSVGARVQHPTGLPTIGFLGATTVSTLQRAKSDKPKKSRLPSRSSDVPVQQPTPAKALGLTIPPAVMQRADEIIE